MITVNQLSFSYSKQIILKEVNFNIKRGNLISVLGPNGAGKSTLFKCILGMIKNYKGTIAINDVDSKTMSPQKRAQWLAYIPQSHANAFDYSVLEMVVMGTTSRLSMFSTPSHAEYEIAYSALEQLGLTDLANRCFNHLSGGEQQLVLIARAIAQQSKVLIMDEPTSNLDFGNQHRVMTHIKDLTDKGYTVLLSSHNPQHALQYSDQILALMEGEIIADGISEEVVNKSLLERLYKTQVDILDVKGERMIRPYSKRRLI